MFLFRCLNIFVLVLLSQHSIAELDPVPIPAENPLTETKRVLGKILFWDEQLSSDDTVACGTCHRPASGGGDPRQGVHPGPDNLFGTDDDMVGSPGIAHLTAPDQPATHPIFGLEPQITGRASPSFIAAMYADQLFWDGRATTQFMDPQDPNAVIIDSGGALENQAIGPILSSVEMAHEGRSWQDVIDKLVGAAPLALATDIPGDMAEAIALDGSYPELFELAFGDNGITAARIGLAIASYERTLVPDQAPWDLYVAGDATAMTETQIAGWGMLEQNTVCLNCHTPPLFSDNKFYNIGLRPSSDDLGREAVTGNTSDRGKFKTPSLRNVGLRPSLMHVGWIADTMDAIDFYNANTSNVTSDHVQFTQDQSGIPTEGGFEVDYASLSMASSSENMRANVADFMANALTDPRVASESYPFDRPILASERQDEIEGPLIIDVMTYNVNVLNWTQERADLIAATVLDRLPDVIGLQEAGLFTLPDLESRLNEEYDIYGFSEADGNSNAIFIKQGRFDVLGSGTTEQGDMAFCVQNRYVTYLHLEEKSSGEMLSVYNTQFCAEQTSSENLPEGMSAQDVNQSHAMTLVNTIDQAIGGNGSRVIALGDFNANSMSETMDFMLKQSSFSSGESNPVELDDTYTLVNNTALVGIDWILMLQDAFEVLNAEVIDNATTQAASDHLPVMASLELSNSIVPTVSLNALEAGELLNISPNSTNVTMLAFSVISEHAAFDLQELILSAEGSGNDQNQVSAVNLFVDENGDGIINTGEQLIGSGQYGLDDGQLVLEVKPGYQLATGQTDFIIGYDF